VHIHVKAATLSRLLNPPNPSPQHVYTDIHTHARTHARGAVEYTSKGARKSSHKIVSWIWGKSPTFVGSCSKESQQMMGCTECSCPRRAERARRLGYEFQKLMRTFSIVGILLGHSNIQYSRRQIELSLQLVPWKMRLEMLN